MPNAERIAVASNAEGGTPCGGGAGNGGRSRDRAAEHYKLAVRAANIEDEPNNPRAS